MRYWISVHCENGMSGKSYFDTKIIDVHPLEWEKENCGISGCYAIDITLLNWKEIAGE